MLNEQWITETCASKEACRQGAPWQAHAVTRMKGEPTCSDGKEGLSHPSAIFG